MAQSAVDSLPSRQLLVTLDLLRALVAALLAALPAFPTAIGGFLVFAGLDRVAFGLNALSFLASAFLLGIRAPFLTGGALLVPRA